jgi:GDP-D-mannose dehydratase
MRKQYHREMLERLTYALVEDIVNASDAEILSEAAEDYNDPKGEADKVRMIFEKAHAITAKKRLVAAREALEKEKAKGQKIIHLDPLRARRKLDSLLRENPEATREFTLAARKGKELSDDDVLGMLEDLVELGLYNPEAETEDI